MLCSICCYDDERTVHNVGRNEDMICYLEWERVIKTILKRMTIKLSNQSKGKNIQRERESDIPEKFSF